MDSGGGFLGCWEAGRLVRHESRRRSMARVADHLSVEDLEAGFRSAQDPTATRHFQVIWLLARGHTIADVAAVTSFVPRWIEQLLARYNAHGPDALGDLRPVGTYFLRPLHAEHVNCFAVVQVVKAAAQCLTIEGDRPQRTRRLSCVQRTGMVAEGGFEIVTAERQEQVAQGVHGRGAPEAGAEDGIQALALEGDKGDDLLVGGRTCECGEDREQQQITHAVALTLRAARIGHFGECGKQGSKWHRGDLYKAERSPL